VHCGAEEHAGAEGIAVEQPVRRERIGQHGNHAEQRDARHRVGGLVVLRTDRGSHRDDRGGAADAGTDADQRAEPVSEADTAADVGDDRDRGDNCADDYGQGLQADGSRLHDRQPDAEQHDAEAQDPHHGELYAWPQDLGQLEQVIDEDAEQDRHHDAADGALLQAERRGDHARKVLTGQRE